MTNFSSWFMEKMNHVNYYMDSDTIVTDTCDWMKFAQFPKTDHFHVCYVKAPISPEAIRISFSSHPNEPILFVVDINLFDFTKDIYDIPYLSDLQKIYFGRIYAWDFDKIVAIRFDWNTYGWLTPSPVEITGILYPEPNTWFKDNAAQPQIARFYDRAFWKEQAPPPRREKKRTPYQKAERERQTRNSWTNTEDVFRDFREAFERNKARYGASDGGTYDPDAHPQYTRGGVSSDKWFIRIWSDGTKDGAKTAYRALGKQYHPDINKDPGATEIMQAINRAYEKVMEIHNG